MGGQDTEEKQERSPQLQADPGRTLSLWRPQFPQVTQEEPCGLPGSELASYPGWRRARYQYCPGQFSHLCLPLAASAGSV